MDVYVDQCCLTPGRYVLTCQNYKGPFGWSNASVEIQGQKYCNNFIGRKARRIVMITGTAYFSYSCKDRNFQWIYIYQKFAMYLNFIFVSIADQERKSVETTQNITDVTIGN